MIRPSKVCLVLLLLVSAAPLVSSAYARADAAASCTAHYLYSEQVDGEWVHHYNFKYETSYEATARIDAEDVNSQARVWGSRSTNDLGAFDSRSAIAFWSPLNVPHTISVSDSGSSTALDYRTGVAWAESEAWVKETLIVDGNLAYDHDDAQGTCPTFPGH